MFQMVVKANGARPYPARHLPEDAAADMLQWVEQHTPETIDRFKAILAAGDDWKADPEHFLFWNLRTIYRDQEHRDSFKAEAIRHLWTLIEMDSAAE